MKRRISQGHAMRSILGRSRVIHFEGLSGAEGIGNSDCFLIVGPPLAFHASMPPSRKRAFNPASRSAEQAFWLISWPSTQYTAISRWRGRYLSQSPTENG